MQKSFYKNIDETGDFLIIDKSPDPTTDDSPPQKKKTEASKLLMGLMKHSGIVKPESISNPFGFDLSRYKKQMTQTSDRDVQI